MSPCSFRSPCVIVALVATGAFAAEPKPPSQEISPPASEWRSYCSAYMKALEGDATASDLDVTYCLGVTKGLLNGMRVGSQLGALSFGSQLAVTYKLDSDQVFKLFEKQTPAQLLRVCAPPTFTASEYVRTVLRHLDKNPDDAKRPIAEVMYEALQAAYPCN
jgi:hypothetical protein